MILQDIQLRDYQMRGVRGVHGLFAQGHRVVLAVDPTGSGKRFKAVWWAVKANEQGREALLVMDRITLVDQMFEEMARFGVECGIIMGSVPQNREARIQIASLATLKRRYMDTGVGLPPADLILIDEGHKETEAYKKLTGQYPAAKVIILTATPVGAQGRSLIPDLASEMYEGSTNSELIRRGFLLPTNVYAPSEPSIEGVRIVKQGEYNQNQLSRRVQSVTTCADVFGEWAPFADRKTIVFAPGVAYCRQLEHDFNARVGPDTARVICAETERQDRQRIFDDFENGDLKVLISVDVLKEGFDAPIASCAIDLQPNAQLRTWWQKVGRIKRPYQGQDNAVLIDMAGNYWKFPHPDDDPPWREITGEETTASVVERSREKGEAKPVMCPKCSFVRKGGQKCPECGYVSAKPMRRIRMGNGKLKLVPATEKKKVEKTTEQKIAAIWKGCLFQGINSNMTLAQVRGFFFRRFREKFPGRYPPTDLPCMPPVDSGEWGRKAKRVHDAKSICAAFRKAKL